MILENNKDKGMAVLSSAIAYFGTNGYTVSLPINDTQWYDLIVEKDGVIQTVQCKFTASKNKQIDLRSTGGTNGSVYDTATNHLLDLLFCADNSQNLFLIPMKDYLEYGNKNRLTLRTNPTAQGFPTYKYLVKKGALL